jgi:uncharacterized protein YdhG (YjbR/CyaY superfamily)
MNAKIMATKKLKPTDEEQVKDWMNKLEHPLKAEIDAVRKIIKETNSSIHEHIKWNAPSYYTSADIVTFNLRATKHVHLVFHHPTIVKIKSTLLEGDYKDRRMLYLPDMKAVKANKKELQRIINESVQLIH